METPPAASHTLHIAGMSCDHCVRAVRQALSNVEGLVVDAVEVGAATVHSDPSVSWGNLEPHVRDALAEAGYALA